VQGGVGIRFLNPEIMLPDTSLYEPDSYFVIVDDDPDDLELITDVCAELNLEDRSKTFNSGEVLLDFLDTISELSLLPSLIVIDFNMPRMSGLTLLHLLKENKRYRHIPVIIYSTTISVLSEKDLLTAGAIFCRQKRTTQIGVRQLLIEFLSIADIYHDYTPSYRK
jgi:CheY-like chemotaxis protein